MQATPLVKNKMHTQSAHDDCIKEIEVGWS